MGDCPHQGKWCGLPRKGVWQKRMIVLAAPHAPVAVTASRLLLLSTSPPLCADSPCLRCPNVGGA
eukprot:5335832-Prymnesium_polylepis.1